MRSLKKILIEPRRQNLWRWPNRHRPLWGQPDGWDDFW